MRNEIIKALVVWGVALLLFALVFGFARSLDSPESYMRIWGTCVNCGKYMPDVTGVWKAGKCPICEECAKGADDGKF